MTPTPVFVAPARWLARTSHPAAPRRSGDLKLDLLAATPAFERWPVDDLVALGAAADLLRADPGVTLAEGPGVRGQWWMPVEGWLLLTDGRGPDRTIPAGRALDGRQASNTTRLRTLREAKVLVSPKATFDALLDRRPRLARALTPLLIPCGGADV